MTTREMIKRELAGRLNDDDQMMLTFNQWCEVNNFSPRTGRRILSGPHAPSVTQLSARKIGISVGNNRAWQASRTR